MNFVTTANGLTIVRGESLKKILSAESFGGNNVYLSLFNTDPLSVQQRDSSAITSAVRQAKKLPDCDAGSVASGLTKIRNKIAAAVIASVMVYPEPVTALEFPSVLPSSQEDNDSQTTSQGLNDLDPLVFTWSDDEFIVSEAVREFCAD